jgi:hypothetical protein
MNHKITEEISSKINNQIAQICASYGDNPKEFMIKMHDLVIAYFCNGCSLGLKLEKYN